MARSELLNVLKSVGPKMVPFFKTVSIFFVLFATEDRSSIFYCIVKIAPIISLIAFVLLHGMSLNEYFRYSRRILLGLIFSVVGDCFLVWKHSYFNFELGLLSFAVAQIMYARAFGWRPWNISAGMAFLAFGTSVYLYLRMYLHGMMSYLAPFYITLICTMAWRAVARVQFFDDLWTWTKLCGCAGAVCFLASDLLIAISSFAVPIPFSHPLIMITYYAAQFGLSLSVVDSQVDELIRIQQNEIRPSTLQKAKKQSQEHQNGHVVCAS